MSIRIYCWDVDDARLCSKTISVCVFAESYEEAIVRGVRSVGTLRQVLRDCPLDDAAISAVLEDHLCTESPRGSWPAEQFVLYYLGGLGHMSTGSDPARTADILVCRCGEQHPVRVGGNRRLGPVRCDCGLVWAQTSDGKWSMVEE